MLIFIGDIGLLHFSILLRFDQICHTLIHSLLYKKPSVAPGYHATCPECSIFYYLPSRIATEFDFMHMHVTTRYYSC